MRNKENKLMRVLRFVGYPHPVIIILLIPLATAMTVYSLIFLDTASVGACISYVLAFYALLTVSLRIPAIISFLKTIKHQNKYVKRYFSDPRLRTNISLWATLIFNTAYAVFQLGLGFKHNALWYYSFAAYYVLLAVMRFFILKYTQTHEGGEEPIIELRRFRFCGIMLAVIHVVLMVIVFRVGLTGSVYHHHEITVIAMAAYTFTAFTLAIINIVKFRKYKSPALSSAKVVSLATALVSMLTLEASMLTAFGEEGQDTFVSVMTTATGGAVTVFILGMAILMIVSSTKKIIGLKRSTDEQQ